MREFSGNTGRMPASNGDVNSENPHLLLDVGNRELIKLPILFLVKVEEKEFGFFFGCDF